MIIPLGNQDLDGSVQINLGAKGIVELELVSTGEKWGRGPKKDVHSSYEAQIDSPVWHLVQALNTLVEADAHTPAVDGFFDRVQPLSPELRKILDDSVQKRSETSAKTALSVERWYKDENWHDSLVRLVSQPTINIEGLVGGYTGPGGKTILPHRAVAKIDMRLVPDMTAKGTLELAQGTPGHARFRRHRSEHDRRIRSDPDTGRFEANKGNGRGVPEGRRRATAVAAARWLVARRDLHGTTAQELAAGQFGLGHGAGAHAPDEYWVVEAANPKVAGMDGAARSFVDLFYALA